MMTPTANRIIVKPLPAPDKVGSLYIPDNHKERPDKGTVVAVGGGAISPAGVLIPMTLKVGDVILYGRYAGMLTIIDDEKHLIMTENDAIAVEE